MLRAFFVFFIIIDFRSQNRGLFPRISSTVLTFDYIQFNIKKKKDTAIRGFWRSNRCLNLKATIVFGKKISNGTRLFIL